MRHPGSSEFEAYFARARAYVEETRGIKVAISELVPPYLGDLDGAKIMIDAGTTNEQRLFLLAHLFGHTVQWNTSPAAAELGRIATPPVDEALLRDLLAYEREAAAYGLGLLHATEILDLDQWFSDQSAQDLDMLTIYYRTGVKQSCSPPQHPAPLVRAKPAPAFVPVARESRWQGVVI